MSNTERELRAAQNQLVFRSVNERIKELGEKILDAVTELDFACECDNANCHAPITMSVEEFTAVDRMENRFIVVRGHEDLEVEDVVAERDGYLIVAKRGAGAELVKEFS